jgi:mRNA interferase HigB
MYLCTYLKVGNPMKLLNKELLEKFVRKNASSSNAVNKWIEQMEKAVFSNPNELKSSFPNVDYVGKSRYVFNIKGNDYRLVAIVFFAVGSLTICFIGTHAEYDKIDCLTIFQK